MTKTKTPSQPSWLRNLRLLMEQQGLNPRALSLKAGLNATAVRDMLEGRSRFPRYDTTRSLAEALGTTPALLMGDAESTQEISTKGVVFGEDVELLTEIISRLQETSEELERKLEPRDFAAMATTIYHRLKEGGESRKGSIGTQIHDLLDYQLLRQKRAKRR